MDDEELDEALRFAGLFASKMELASLFRMLDGDGSGRVSLHEVVDRVRGAMSERRVALVHKAWSALGGVGAGRLAIASLLGSLRASTHPDVVAGRFDEDGLTQDVADALADASIETGGDGSAVDGTAFSAFHADLSGTMPSDDLFVDWVECAWGVTEAALGRADAARIGSFKALVAEKSRQKKRTGESIRSHLTRTFKFHDGAEDGWLTIAEFRRALETLGLPLDVRQATLFFRQFPCRGGGPGEPAERVEWASFVAQVVKDGADGDVGL